MIKEERSGCTVRSGRIILSREMDSSCFVGNGKSSGRKSLGQVAAVGKEMPSKEGKSSRKSPVMGMGMGMRLSRGGWKPFKKKGKCKNSRGQGNGKPSKKKTIKSTSQGTYSKPSVDDPHTPPGSEKLLLRYNVIKPSKKDRKSLGSASKCLNKPAAVDQEIFDMWKSFYFHDHDLCIQSSRERTFEEIPFMEAMATLCGVEEQDLQVKFERDDSEDSDYDEPDYRICPDQYYSSSESDDSSSSSSL